MVAVINALISTKFHIPLTPGRMTNRPRLDARLDDGLSDGCRLVLVTAPAGFGKSTLVSLWLREQNTRYAWLSLDSGDNEPRQFLSYLVGALQHIDAALGASLVNRIQTADSGDSEAVYTDVITHLVNEITAYPDPFILVMDDCHLLKNPTILQLLIFLIERQPAQMHLVMLSREDLPLPVSRLRVRRQVIEIRQAELQFSLEETKDFLMDGMGITNLSSEEILALEQRTEGWIAGLQLAALSLRFDPDPAQFIHSFTGSDRFILDYFLDEVFSRQPVEIQNFLLATSILERFCALVCDEVLAAYQGNAASANHSQAMLELIEHSNLFLIPLDNQRQWYRYHHLFGDLLRHALQQAAPQKIPVLHLRASQWMEANHLIPDAVRHAFLTQDWIYAAELVERHAWNVIMHSQVSTVSEWCSVFPEAIIRKRPALCIFHAWALVIAFKKDNYPSANHRLEQAEAALGEIDPDTLASLNTGAPPARLHPWVTGQITLLRSFILMSEPRTRADPQGLIALGQKAYDQLPKEEIPARSAALLDICYASQGYSDAEDAERKFTHTIEVALSGGNYFGAVIGEYHRAHGLFVQGRLREVIRFCQEKRKYYQSFFENPIQELPALALFDQATGCALLELNELEQAEQLLCAGLEVGQWMPREELPGYLALARLYAVKGDGAGWSDALRRLDMRWPDITYCTQAMRVLYPLKFHPDDSEARAAALAWVESHPPDVGPGVLIPGIGPAWNDEGDYAVFTAWAQIQIILGRAGEAQPVILPMLDSARDHKLFHRIIELSLLKAQAHYSLGEKAESWENLKAGLDLAESCGYLRLSDHGAMLVRLLTEAAALGMAPSYIRRLLEADQRGSDQAGRVENLPVFRLPGQKAALSFGLVEPLSDREIEVLSLLAEGFSNAEIAARLYLSPNTLKSHTQNIYGKLEVHSRLQAVNKARELGII